MRTRGLVKDGERRVTSFIISTSNQKMLPFYMSSYYKEPHVTDADNNDLKQTLDSEMSKVLGAVDGVQKSKGLFKQKKPRSDSTHNYEGFMSNAYIDPDAQANAAPLPPETHKKKKKKKRRQIQPLEIPSNDKFPVMGHSHDRQVTPTSDIPHRASNYEIQSEVRQPEHEPIRSDPEICPNPVRRARPLPPKPKAEPNNMDNDEPYEAHHNIVTGPLSDYTAA